MGYWTHISKLGIKIDGQDYIILEVGKWLTVVTSDNGDIQAQISDIWSDSVWLTSTEGKEFKVMFSEIERVIE